MGSIEKKSVAIVGAGISGLAALKECLAEGLNAVAFEAKGWIGGSWAYSKDFDESPMYEGVIVNSSRDTTSFTDFPLDPARYPDFFSHRRFLEYLHEYADHFGLKKHIRLRTRVLQATPNKDGSWTVKIQEEGKEEVEERVFSAFVAATGHLTTPNIPHFEGRDSFKGTFIHSNRYKTPGPFEGKKIVIVGIGSSAVDIACEVGPQAKELHLITRRGGWVLPRYCFGKTLESFDNRATQVWMPHSLAQWLQTKLLQFVDGTPPPELKPDHKILEQNPTIRGDFNEKVRTGIIKIQRAGINRFTPTGLELSSGVTLEDVDVVIACTGYRQLDLPYLPADTLRSEQEGTPELAADLYKLTASPRYRNLFVCGYVELWGPLPPIVDAQGRFIAAVVSGRVRLPSTEGMRAELAVFHAMQARSFVRSSRHVLTGYQMQTIDALLEPLGAAPTLARLLGRVLSRGGGGGPWTALRTLWAIVFGVPSSAQWRLCGHGRTEELATETVLRIAKGEKALSKREVEILGAKVGGGEGISL